MFGVGVPEMIILGIIGVLLFGKRLPEVGRSLGKGIMEFKKGVSGVQDEIDRASSGQSSRSSHSAGEEREEATAPRFEPPPEEPAAEAATPQPASQATA
jgi:sec-independent protein translocase protein TatA